MKPPPGAGLIARVGGDAEQICAGWWPGHERLPDPAFFAYGYPAPEGIDRVSIREHEMLRRQIPPAQFITIDNEFVVRGELPAAMAGGPIMRIPALPDFLKTYIDRLTYAKISALDADLKAEQEERAGPGHVSPAA